MSLRQAPLPNLSAPPSGGSIVLDLGVAASFMDELDVVQAESAEDDTDGSSELSEVLRMLDAAAV